MQMVRAIAGSLTALALALSIAVAPAVAETAMQVRNWCKFMDQVQIDAERRLTIPNKFAAGFCWGAFAALQVTGRMVANKAQRPLHFCAPPDSSRVGDIKIFLRYTERHPELAQEDFAIVALDALIEAYPCPAPPKPQEREG